MRLSDTINITKYSGGKFVETPDTTIHEYSLALFIGGNYKTTLFCSPSEIHELIYGYLYAEGIISDMHQIENIFLNEVSASADVSLIYDSITDIPESGSCSVNDRSDIKYNKDILLNNLTEFYKESELFEATGGVHKCALCDDSGIILSCIDVSRHNAFDKVIGSALSQDIKLTDKYLITSGRVPQDMVKKAIRSRVRMLVSRAAPTLEAVESARSNELTLLGFAKQDRFNIYCGDAIEIS